ncbi:MAG: acylphosphatase [Spirochaetaceae bacterium]|nr:acylphosphatase [Spirochaetaceae bacterium]
MPAFHAIIIGEVQGVGFRMSAVMRAERLGLTGWVRNTEDGNVEVWAEGPSEPLERFAQWLQTGPSAARVDRVLRTDEEPRGIYHRFSVAF